MNAKIINTQRSLPLPRGATLLSKPKARKCGGYFELVYDASIRVFGLDWFRVQDGFGQGDSSRGKHLRDDWVADVPSVAVSVSADDWHTPVFDRPCEYKNMRAAMRGALEEGLRDATRNRESALEALTTAQNAVAILTTSLTAKT